MRLGDSITISRTEAEVLGSDEFQKFVSGDVASRVLLTPSDAGYYSLALPEVGEQIIAALSAFAAARSSTRCGGFGGRDRAADLARVGQCVGLGATGRRALRSTQTRP